MFNLSFPDASLLAPPLTSLVYSPLPKKPIEYCYVVIAILMDQSLVAVIKVNKSGSSD